MSELQYVDIEFVRDVTGASAPNLTTQIISQAEKDIDNYLPIIASDYFQPYSKANQRVLVLQQNQQSWTNNSLTISTVGRSANNEYQFCVIEFASKNGSYARGYKIPVTSSTIVGSNTVLNFDDIPDFTVPNTPIKIYQKGKMPFQKDFDFANGAKFLDTNIVEAMAWQSLFLLEKGDTADAIATASNTSNEMKSESIGSSYSYTKNDSNNLSKIQERISPKARDLIKAVYGEYPENLIASL